MNFDIASDAYDRFMGRYSQQLSAQLADLAAIRPGQGVLDVGCVEGWLEGESAQTLHIGPYGAEYPTISRLRAVIADAGFRPRGCHHEIYLSGANTPS